MSTTTGPAKPVPATPADPALARELAASALLLVAAGVSVTVVLGIVLGAVGLLS